MRVVRLSIVGFEIDPHAKFFETIRLHRVPILRQLWHDTHEYCRF